MRCGRVAAYGSGDQPDSNRNEEHASDDEDQSTRPCRALLVVPGAGFDVCRVEGFPENPTEYPETAGHYKKSAHPLPGHLLRTITQRSHGETEPPQPAQTTELVRMTSL